MVERADERSRPDDQERDGRRLLDVCSDVHEHGHGEDGAARSTKSSEPDREREQQRQKDRGHEARRSTWPRATARAEGHARARHGGRRAGCPRSSPAGGGLRRELAPPTAPARDDDSRLAGELPDPLAQLAERDVQRAGSMGGHSSGSRTSSRVASERIGACASPGPIPSGARRRDSREEMHQPRPSSERPARRGCARKAAAHLLAEREDALVDDPVVDVVPAPAPADDAGAGEHTEVLADVLFATRRVAATALRRWPRCHSSRSKQLDRIGSASTRKRPAISSARPSARPRKLLSQELENTTIQL